MVKQSQSYHKNQTVENSACGKSVLLFLFFFHCKKRNLYSGEIIEANYNGFFFIDILLKQLGKQNWYNFIFCNASLY